MTATFADRIRGVSTSGAIKAPVRVATTGAIALSGTQTIDGIAVVADDRVLVRHNGSDNGIWIVAAGAWTRALDMNGARDVVQGTEVYVRQGTVGGDLRYAQTAADPVVGTTSLVWTSISGTVTAQAEAASSEAQQYRDQAALNAIAAGAPLYTTAPTAPFSGVPSPYMLQTVAGVQVYTHNGATATLIGWLGEILFDTVTALIASTLTGFAVGTYVRTRKEGFAYRVVSSGQHLTTDGGVKLVVQTGPDGCYAAAAFGCPLDGFADDSVILKTAIDAVKVDGIHDAPPVIVVRPGETLNLESSCVIDEGSVVLEGYGALLLFAADNALDIGDATYLTDIAEGNYSFILRGFFATGSSGNTSIRNRGYRKIWLDEVYSLGGETFLDTEGAFAGSGMRRCRIQNTTDRSVKIKQRNNGWSFDSNAITGAGAPAVSLSTDSAELKGVQFYGRNDIEGSAGGILVEGEVSILGIDGVWFENNTAYNITIDNTTGTANKDAISITRCNLTGAGVDVLIGTDASGTEINGLIVQGNEFADSDLIIIGGDKVKNARIGPDRLSGTGVYTFPTASSMFNDTVNLPPARVMPLHSTAPALPFGTGDTKGVLGEIRWGAGVQWMKTSLGWLRGQLGAVVDSTTLAALPTGATPAAAGLGICKTNNSGATTVTDITGGYVGQKIEIVGFDGGNTTIQHGTNIRLLGGANFTLGDNDSIVLVSRNGTVWFEQSRSNNN